MSAKCIILPSGEVLRPYSQHLAQVSQVGLSWTMLVQLILNNIVQDDAIHPLQPMDLQGCLLEYLIENNLITQRQLEFVQSDGFVTTFYALYRYLFDKQRVFLDYQSSDAFISGVSLLQWIGRWDIAISVELTPFYTPRATYNGMVL